MRAQALTTRARHALIGGAIGLSLLVAASAAGAGHAAAATTTDTCGYDPTATPVFNENTLATWIQLNGTGPSETVSAYANDENGILLGVTDTTTNAPVTPFSTAGSTTLTSDITHGNNYTSLSVSPLPTAYASGDQITITSGAANFNVHLTADAAQGATTLAVQSFNPNQTYAAGSMVNDQQVDNAQPYGHAHNPLLGDLTKLDASNRPQYPAIFVTNLTVDGANSTAGDWQHGGTSQSSLADIFGTWVTGAYDSSNAYQKPAPPTVQNKSGSTYLYGPGSDAPGGTLASSQNENFGAELRWNVSSLVDDHGAKLAPGNMYRFQVILHDGDQNKTGGDVGELCVNLGLPAGPPPPSVPEAPLTALLPLALLPAAGLVWMKRSRRTVV